MTTEELDDNLEPEQRVREIKLLFRSLSNGISEQIQVLRGAMTKADAAKLKLKLVELETAHLSLVKAEEAFHEKTKHDIANSGPDYDVIRDQLGRALDRIRAAQRTSKFFGVAD